jgi:hypothetical protein
MKRRKAWLLGVNSLPKKKGGFTLNEPKPVVGIASGRNLWQTLMIEAYRGG